jgi:hypothetical protein
MYEDYTESELIKTIKSSENRDAFLMLLKKTIERVADVRNKIPDITNDNIELRNGIVHVLNISLVAPLTTEKQIKHSKEQTDYN